MQIKLKPDAPPTRKRPYRFNPRRKKVKEEGRAQIGKKFKVERKYNIGRWSTRKAIRRS